MSDDAAPIKPKIDDVYWFTFSETMVTKAQEARDQAAGKLQNLVLWLWGIYTGFAALGFTLAGKTLPFSAKVLIVAASGALIAVYWATVWVQMPVSIKFDPRSPTQIKRAYVTSTNEKGKRLKITLGLSVLAALLVTLAIVTASLSREQKTAAAKFAAAVQSKNGVNSLSVTGMVGQTPTATVTLQPQPPKGDPPAPRSRSYIPDDGLVQVSIPLEGMALPLTVSLEWEDPSTGVKVRLSREIKEAPDKQGQTTK